MAEFRDYGYFEGGQTPTPTPVDLTKNTQVYIATHNEDGTRRPHMYRSFISFSYGGKWIEDFSLIAVTDGDRLSHSLHADFTDITHDPEVYDGQHYWDTHLKANAWDLTLSTDGITDAELEEFRRWFAPGVIRELILAEHPNRGIMARISTTPTYSMIPFEGESEINIAGTMHTVKTTLYKGDITISFVMDDPYWYAINSIIQNNKIINDAKGYTNDNEVEGKLLREDALKVVYEDNIPLEEQTNSNIFMYYGEPNTRWCKISSSELAYLYYAGTAPCKPIFQLMITPTINSRTHLVTFPNNSYSASTPYSIIRFTGINTYEFKFTTPSIFTGYNQAVSIFTNLVPDNNSWEDVRTLLRDGVKHFAPRAFAIMALNIQQANADTQATVSAENITAILDIMPNFFKDMTYTSNIFKFNCRTGQATATLYYNTITYVNNEIIYTPQTTKEDVGDMIRSDYLSLEDRNHSDSNGQISKWNTNEPTNSYKISGNWTNGVVVYITLEYQNLYY